MAEAERKHQKLKNIVEASRYWDAEDLLKNLEGEMQRMEQGLSHVIWDLENRPVTQCPFPLPATPKFETDSTQDEFNVKVTLPGIRKEDITIRVAKDSVEVYARQEDKICRPFYISVDSRAQLDPDNVSSKLESGVLRISVRKVKKTKVKIQ